MSQTMLAENLDLYNSIFKKRGDHYLWINYMEYARRQTLIEPELSLLWVGALETLKAALGGKFLEQVRGTHPLTRWIVGIDRTSAKRLIQIADLVRYLKATDPNYESFRQRLQSRDWAKRETMGLLVVGHLLRSAGLDLQTIPENPPLQTPDFLISDPSSNQKVYGELSGLSVADKFEGPARDYEIVYRVIIATLKNPFFSANLLTLIPPNYPEHLTTVLQALEGHVRESQEGSTYTDEYLTITQFPIDQESQFSAWMNKYDRRKGFHGIPQYYDDTERIGGNKILDKGEQTSSMGPGVLFLPVPWQHFWQQRVTQTVARLQSRMSAFHGLFGTFLFSEIIHVDPQSFRFHADDGFLRRPLADALTLYSLFIPNPAFNGSIENSTIKKLLFALDTAGAAT